MHKSFRFVSLILLLVLISVLNVKAYSFDDLIYSSVVSSGSDEIAELFSFDVQTLYLKKDTAIRKNQVAVSAIVAMQDKGTAVNIMAVNYNQALVISNTGIIGFVDLDDLTDSLENIFYNADMTMYATAKTDIKSRPAENSTTLATLSKEDDVHVIGTNDYDYWQVEWEGEICYVDHNDLTETKPVHTISYDKSLYVSEWTGSVLTKRGGVNMGPSGKETYYNLDMSYVVYLMKTVYGVDYEYWVRSDGVKMYGDYVMIAADFSIPGRSPGSLLPTSLGMGIVCDTGTFIYTNPYQIDIAVSW